MIFFIVRFIFNRKTHRLLWLISLLSLSLSIIGIVLALLPRETLRELRHMVAQKLKSHAEFMMRVHYIIYQGLWRRGNGR